MVIEPGGQRLFDVVGLAMTGQGDHGGGSEGGRLPLAGSRTFEDARDEDAEAFELSFCRGRERDITRPSRGLRSRPSGFAGVRGNPAGNQPLRQARRRHHRAVPEGLPVSAHRVPVAGSRPPWLAALMPIVDLATHEGGVCRLQWAFDLDREMVWEALTDQIWLRRWLGTPTGDLAPGHVIEVVHGDDAMGPGTQRSTILVCLPPRRLEATWTMTGEPLSVVDVRLAPKAGASGRASGTLLTLIHTGLGERGRDYAIAWHAHLLYLAAALRASPLAMERFWEVHERIWRAYVAD